MEGEQIHIYGKQLFLVLSASEADNFLQVIAGEQNVVSNVFKMCVWCSKCGFTQDLQ